MKILYCIAGTRHSGGMERVLANKANWLVRHGYEVAIVTTDQEGEKPFFPLDERIECYDLGIGYEQNNGKSFINKLLHYPIKQYRHRKRLTTLLQQVKLMSLVVIQRVTLKCQESFCRMKSPRTR